MSSNKKFINKNTERYYKEYIALLMVKKKWLSFYRFLCFTKHLNLYSSSYYFYIPKVDLFNNPVITLSTSLWKDRVLEKYLFTLCRVYGCKAYPQNIRYGIITNYKQYMKLVMQYIFPARRQRKMSYFSTKWFKAFLKFIYLMAILKYKQKSVVNSDTLGLPMDKNSFKWSTLGMLFFLFYRLISLGAPDLVCYLSSSKHNSSIHDFSFIAEAYLQNIPVLAISEPKNNIEWQSICSSIFFYQLFNSQSFYLLLLWTYLLASGTNKRY